MRADDARTSDHRNVLLHRNVLDDDATRSDRSPLWQTRNCEEFCGARGRATKLDFTRPQPYHDANFVGSNRLFIGVQTNWFSDSE